MLKLVLQVLTKFLIYKKAGEIKAFKFFLFSSSIIVLNIAILLVFSSAVLAVTGNFYKKIEYWNNFLEKEHELTKESLGQFLASMNSYLGIMGQYSTYKLRKKMLTENLSLRFNEYIYFKRLCKT